MKITEIIRETEKIMSINTLDGKQVISVLTACALLIAGAIIAGG